MTAAIVIAHRGASGYLPEHTLPAKALAYGLGADYLEQDVVATRDSELVVLHDIHLDDVTDVAQHFPDRRREDGYHYVVDFDLAELRELTLFERRNRDGSPRFPLRFPATTGMGSIVTLDEELRLVQGLNKSTGRRVGIYPEIKHPRWHAEHGIDLSRLLVEKLAGFGYSQPADPVYLQCFDAAELKRVRRELGCELKLTQLVDAGEAYTDLLTPEGLRATAAYADGLGPHHAQLVASLERRPDITPLGRWAHDSGLQLHPYTFRADDLPPYGDRLEAVLRLFFEGVGVQGVFCDHPDIAVRARDAAARPGR